MALSDVRRAAVLGSPVAHSLSPVLHGAAYRALGLTGWSYERVECDAEALPGFVESLDEAWVGLSVTMPGKRAASAFAAERTDRAAILGAANTLVRSGSGWRADCTDVDGVVGALRAAGGVSSLRSAVLLGGGGTAAAALAGLVDLGARQVRLVVREPARATEVKSAAEALGVALQVERFDEVDLPVAVADSDVVVSTLPAGAVDADAETLAAAPCVLDVVYHPWPTPLAEAVRAEGAALATGLDMLLHQSFGQVEQFTGAPAPREAMRDALREATHDLLPLPLT
ncbi:shikimate dehydrogenase [Allosaccharopolyspora coralli]|uniref:Shikimate dehydrogenase n=1 Tax=Allosaccharopolyspora coralli TaxID=2665642 RepID=A0A5Q3Q4W8_9PSEU|nr:shikimate dehydrogenase [Allosaccharopolyspora coralli]QGK69658.1 shikimate dehydrogenase [Allosaccharopolyspora coralli]